MQKTPSRVASGASAESEPGMLGEPAPVACLRLDLRGGIVLRAGHPVLLHHEPAVVAVEPGEEAVEVGVAGAELAERAGAPGLGPVARAAHHLEPDVLQVQVLDSRA